MSGVGVMYVCMCSLCAVCLCAIFYSDFVFHS